VQGTTKSGFKFEVNEEAVKSMEFIDLVAELDEKPMLIGKVVSFMLGEDQKEKLYKHVRGDKKYTPAKDVDKEVNEIFDIINEAPETKN
jgi:hypothetical protein